MSEEIVLRAETTRQLGTRPTRRLRSEGKVPGVIYGKSLDPQPVSVAWSELRQVLTTDAGLNALIELDVDGERHLSIVKEMQRHPVRRTIEHVDFLAIERGVALEVTVPLEIVGEPKGLLDEGGIVEQIAYEIVVKAIPSAIPNSLEVDISGLLIGHAIKVSDIAFPEGVTTELDPEESLVLGAVPAREVEPEPVEGEEGEEGAEASDGEGAEGDADSSDDGGDSDSDG